MRQDADGPVVFRQQPDGSVRHHFNGMHIESTPLFSGSRHLVECLCLRVETMDTVVISQQPQKAVTIFIHTIYTVIGQTDVVSLTGLVCFESITVETVDTIPSSKPKVVFMILQDVHHRILG